MMVLMLTHVFTTAAAMCRGFVHDFVLSLVSRLSWVSCRFFVFFVSVVVTTTATAAVATATLRKIWGVLLTTSDVEIPPHQLYSCDTD